MKTNFPLTVSAGMYVAVGLLLLIALTWQSQYTGRALDGTLVGVTLLLAAICTSLGYAAFSARAGTTAQKKRFAFFAAIFCGSMAGIGGWFLGILLGIPLFIGLWGMRGILWQDEG